MSDAAKRAMDRERAYMDLEHPIRELACMAGLTASFADNTGPPRCGDAGEKRAFDELHFGITRVAEMAKALDEAFLAGSKLSD
jgi:hypothetical protein